MTVIRFMLAALATIGLLYMLDQRIQSGENTLPPIGKFFSPQHGFWLNAESTDVRQSQHEISFPNLDGDVSVIFDDQMVPHIYAQTDRDAAFAQGYVSAMLRLFQMDLSTRAPLGRLSEILGERTLEHDLGQRRKGIPEAAERLAASWESDPQVKPLLQAFTDGVNAWIADLDPRNYPLEFKLLDFQPEPWTFIKSAGFIMAMSETLARTAHDIPLSNAYQLVGPEEFAFLYPWKNPHDIPVIPDTSAIPVTLHSSVTPIPNQQWGYQDWLPESDAGVGSNNWAISPARTQNHLAMLCNDPHLALTLPSIWLEMQITTPQYTAYGVAFPALLGISIGFSKDAAWGFTNAGHDVMDWYSIRWTDAQKTTYLLDGKETKAVLRPEIVQVRGREEPVIDTVRFTVWGPVTNLKSGTPGADLAMHWLPLLDIDNKMALAFAQINQSKTVDQWLAPLNAYDAPMQNALFATATGDIALRVSGKLPLRNGTDGRLIQDGSLSTVGWTGFVQDQDNPFSLNPPQGYIASANQQSTNSTYPFPYYGIFEDWRGRYLNQQLRSKDSLTIEDMMALQSDNTSLFALEALPIFSSLLTTSNLTEPEKNAFTKLKKWNCQYDALNEAPLLFELWQGQVDSLTWDELYAAKDSIPVEIPEEWRLLDLLKETPDNQWFDLQSTSKKEMAADIVTLAFHRAAAAFTLLSSEGKGSWSSYKSTDIMHLARIPAFSEMDLELGGNRFALNAITSTNGPSWRMIVELGENYRAFGIYPGGQSGNPGSPYYRNFIPTWQKGEYRTLRIQSKEEAQKAGHVLSLTMKKQ